MAKDERIIKNEKDQSHQRPEIIYLDNPARRGDYPEELNVVLGKIKRDKHYDYKPMGVILVCAFIPLVIGASVGPEAGLTGIIAGLS